MYSKGTAAVYSNPIGDGCCDNCGCLEDPRQDIANIIELVKKPEIEVPLFTKGEKI